MSRATPTSVALGFGNVWAVAGVWQQLRIGTTLKEKAAASRREFDLEARIHLMVVNQQCDPPRSEDEGVACLRPESAGEDLKQEGEGTSPSLSGGIFAGATISR